MVDQWKAAEEYSCRVVRTKKGNVARVHGSAYMSSEGVMRLERLIDAATEQMISRDTK